MKATVFVCEEGHPYHLVYPDVRREGEVMGELDVVERTGCRCGKRCAAVVDLPTEVVNFDLRELAQEAGIRFIEGDFHGRSIFDLKSVPEQYLTFLPAAV